MTVTAASASAAGGPPPASLLSILSSPSSESTLHRSLKEWNDEIESTNFGLASLGGVAGGRGDGTAADLLAQVQPASEALHAVLVEEISSRAEVLACGCGHCGDACGVTDEDGLDCSSSTAADDEQDVAARAAASSIRRYRRMSANANESTAPNSAEDLAYVSTAQKTSELLRAIKNVIRYTNSVRMMLGLDRFARGGAGADDKAVADDPLRRLRSVGMLRVYQEVLVGCTCPDDAADNTNANANARPRDDAARNASLAMFHACYGAPDANPAATRARTLLVGEVGFIPDLMHLLGRGARANTDELALPPPLLLSLTRHVHSFVGCDPKVVPAMDKACQAIGGIDDGESSVKSLVSVLVDILSATVLGGDDITRFPGTETCDRRPDLASEVLRILFALRATGVVPDPSSVSKDLDDAASSAVDFDTMTRIGEIACCILKLPPSGRSVSTKLAVVNLLMDAPKGYATYLLNEGAIPSLLLIIRCQVDDVIERKTGSFNADAATLVPIVAVLDRLSADDNAVQQLVKSEVFPPNEEEAYQTRAAQERAKGGGGRAGLNTKNMHPALEAAPGTLRWKMIRLMTWPESNVKRCASELLWRLCDCDATEFVLRVGFGNAVHMLGIKGLVQVPSSSFG